jgi:hypothetical protein
MDPARLRELAASLADQIHEPDAGDSDGAGAEGR